jgi:hypothetical protein
VPIGDETLCTVSDVLKLDALYSPRFHRTINHSLLMLLPRLAWLV